MSVLDGIVLVSVVALVSTGAAVALGVALWRARKWNSQVVSAVNEISGNFSIWDQKDKLVLFNKRFALDLAESGYSPQLGDRFEDYIRQRVANNLAPEALGQEEGWIAARLHRHREPGPAFEIQLDDSRWNLVTERRTDAGGIVIYGIDISELKLAEAKRAESEKRFRDFASAAADWFWEADAEHKFCFVSDNIYRITGLHASDLIGRSRDQTAETSDDPELWAEHLQTLERQAPFREFTVRRPLSDGGYVWTAISGVPHFAPDGAFAGYRGVGRNVTELIEAKQALEYSEARSRALAKSAQEARLAAEAASRAKSEFLASMSHEFRTPLNAILGFGQLLVLEKSENLSDKQHEYLQLISQSGEHLLSLVNEILDLAAIEAGQLSLSIVKLDPNDIIREIVQTMEPVAAEADVQVRVEQQSVPLAAFADPIRLKQILLNLVSNAIKYNKAGGSVDVMVTQDPAAVRITVTDTGKGIPEELHSQLFYPFNRLGAESTGIVGAGIGLALCERLAVAMNGEIGFESAAGTGSKFWISLPSSQAHHVEGQGSHAAD